MYNEYYKEMCIAAESSEQELRRQLREAAAELSDVDTVIEELQEELRQFQVRKGTNVVSTNGVTANFIFF